MGNMFKENDENKSIMQFNSKNANLYMNETADNCLVITPISAPWITISYRDNDDPNMPLKELHVRGCFIEDGRIK